MMRPTRTTPLLTRLLAGAACIGALGLSACAQGSPGVVAEVGSTRITESQLDAAFDGVSQAFGEESGPVNKAAVVNALVVGVICDQIAAENKITITDGDRDERLLVEGDDSGKALLSNPESKQVAYDLADQQILAAKLGEAEYKKLRGAAKVELNPRYGVWQAGEVLLSSGSLSQPAASASPSAPR